MNTKLKLCYDYSLKQPIENENDPIYKLISNYSEIEIISNNKKDNFKHFLYFNKKKIHKILYDEEENIKIISEDQNNLSELFYLSLLILDNSQTLNYEYSLDYFKSINNTIKELKPIKKIILSKILLSLNYNFRGEEEFDETENDQEVKQMEEDNKKIIQANLNILENLNIENINNIIYDCKIDYIYLEILSSLIKGNKFVDLNYCEDIFQQLDLENINITKTIFEGLAKVLDSKDNFMEKYNINRVNDLFNEEKINFYYLLIRYIFKNTFYIYNIKFLSKNIIKLIKLIKQKPNETISLNNIQNLNYIINSKIKEILKFVSDKYNDIYNNFSNNTQLSINGYSMSISKYFSNERKNNDGGKMFDMSNLVLEEEEGEGEGEGKVKIEYEKAKEILNNLKFKIKISPIKNNEKENKFEYKEISYGKERKKIENKDELKLNENYGIITNEDKKYNDGEIVYKNYKKFVIFMNEIEEYIKKSGIQFNPEIEFELIREEKEINNDNAHNEFKDLYNITCYYTFYNQKNNNEKMTFKDENILVHSMNGNSQGFINLMNELNNEDYQSASFEYND